MSWYLLLDKSKEHHDLIEDGFYILFAYTFQAFPQFFINEKGNKFWRFVVLVDEMLKRLIN